MSAWFTDKGGAKSSVTVQHERLADADAVETTRAWWRERLTELGTIFTQWR